MKKYVDTVINSNTGRAISGATVSVYDEASVLADLYSDDDLASTTNPVTTDENGLFQFHVADGVYSLVTSYTNSDGSTTTVTIDNVEIYDDSDADARIGRALLVPEGETGVILPGIATRAGKFAQFDAEGNIVAADGTGADEGLRVDMAASSRSTLVGFINSGTGATARTVQAKSRDFISVKDFGATGDGTTDDTTYIQAALDTGSKNIFFPEGTYKCGALTIPRTKNLCIYGMGTGSQIIMKSGATSLFKWDQTSMYTLSGTIRDLYFDGPTGAGHLIDLTGVGNIDLKGLFCRDIPVGYSFIHVDGAGGARTYDVRIVDCRCYSSTAGDAGISFGALAADSMIANFWMHGNHVVNYCLKFESGSKAVNVSDSHPYGALLYVIHASGASYLTFDGINVDHGDAGNVYMTGTTHTIWTNCYFQNVEPACNAVTLVSSSIGHTFVNCMWQSTGAVSMVASDSSCGSVRVFMGDATVADWSNGFDLQGANSTVRGIAGHSPLGMSFGFSGVATANTTGGSTTNMGVNALQATAASTQYFVPYDGKLVDATVAVDAAPGAGKTITVQAYKNGSTLGSSTTIANTATSAVLTLNQGVSANDRIHIEAVYSATATSSRLRWAARFIA